MLNKRLLLKYFLYAQKSICHIKSIKTSRIVNEVIRGNFTSTKKIKRIKSIKSKKRIKSIKTLNKQLSLRCFYTHKKRTTTRIKRLRGRKSLCA